MIDRLDNSYPLGSVLIPGEPGGAIGPVGVIGGELGVTDGGGGSGGGRVFGSKSEHLSAKRACL